MAAQRSHPFNTQPGYLSNGASGAPGAGPAAGTGVLPPSNGRVIQTSGGRVLCVADVRGNLRSLNDLAKQARADHIIHTGDFGFYDESSIERIAEKTLKHVAQYSPLLSESVKKSIQQPGQQQARQRFAPGELPLSELSLFLNKTYTLDVPVYAVWGACEDVRVLEKFRSSEYKIEKLHIIDEANSRLLEIGGVKLRILGLGGAVVMHKLFDNGEGRTTIAGGQGTMWTTLLQMGELVDTANRVYDPTETRIFVTHASPAREGLLNQLSVTLKADFSISAGLHFRYGSSYNEFSVNPTLDHYRGKLAASKASFNDVWETVKTEVEPAVDQNESQKVLLANALDIVQRMPGVANGGNPFGGPVNGPNAGGQVDESAFKNMWNFNLADASFGWLVLEVEGGRIGTEMKAQGFNFAHRTGKHAQNPPQTQTSAPITGSGPPSTTNVTQAPAQAGVGQNRQAPQQPYSQAQRNQPTQQQTKPPSGPTANTPSPAAPIASQAKPATPQPTGQKVNIPQAAEQKPSTTKAETTRNGTSAAENATPTNAKSSSPVENKPSTGIFVQNMSSEDATRNLFSDEEKLKIVKVTTGNNSTFTVHFKTPEDAKAALDRQPAERTGPSGRRDIPHLRPYEDRRRFPRGDHAEGGAGRWQGSNRGGPNTGAGTGYRSASDSDTARGGRGGRGGRGSFRGERGERGERGGRGGRGGRGNYNKGGEGTTPASSTPATPAATPSGGDS